MLPPSLPEQNMISLLLSISIHLEEKQGGLEVSADFSNFSLGERIAHQAIVVTNLFGYRISDDMCVRQNIE